MTQLELAKAAGYSIRLISKAEAGQALAAGTISDLADALSTKEESVSPEDLVSDPIAMAMKYIEALYVHQRNLVSKIRYFLDEEVVFDICGDPNTIPFAGVHHGIDGVDRAIQAFFDVLEVPKNHNHLPHYSYLANGTNVTVWGKSWIHPIGRPITTPMPISNLFQFRNGKLCRFEDNYDTQMTAKILTEGTENSDACSSTTFSAS